MNNSRPLGQMEDVQIVVGDVSTSNINKFMAMSSPKFQNLVQDSSKIKKLNSQPPSCSQTNQHLVDDKSFDFDEAMLENEVVGDAVVCETVVNELGCQSVSTSKRLTNRSLQLPVPLLDDVPVSSSVMRQAFPVSVSAEVVLSR